MQREKLYHITTEKEAREAAAVGSYVPAAFDREGFIHCSYARQVAATANRIFRGRTNLVVFEIAQDRVTSRIVDENLEGGSELFPHIYGRLPMAAVVTTIPFPCDSEGRFAFP